MHVRWNEMSTKKLIRIYIYIYKHSLLSSLVVVKKWLRFSYLFDLGIMEYYLPMFTAKLYK